MARVHDRIRINLPPLLSSLYCYFQQDLFTQLLVNGHSHKQNKNLEKCSLGMQKKKLFKYWNRLLPRFCQIMAYSSEIKTSVLFDFKTFDSKNKLQLLTTAIYAIINRMSPPLLFKNRESAHLSSLHIKINQRGVAEAWTSLYNKTTQNVSREQKKKTFTRLSTHIFFINKTYSVGCQLLLSLRLQKLYLRYLLSLFCCFTRLFSRIVELFKWLKDFKE